MHGGGDSIAAMTTDDLEAVLASGFAKLREARAAETPTGPAGAVGRDREGLVDVTVDGQGILTGVVFDDDLDELRPAELRAALLEAIADAHGATGRTRLSTLPDIGDSEVSAGARWALGMEER